MAVELAYERRINTFVEPPRRHIDTLFSDIAKRRNEFHLRHLRSADKHF